MPVLETLTDATGIAAAMPWLILLPLIVSAFLMLSGRIADGWGHFLATLVPIVGFCIALSTFLQLQAAAPQQRNLHVNLWEWFSGPAVHARFGMLIDPLSILFAMLITGVGSLIHIYSIGYMAHDPRRRRFFAYLNLFVAAMLTLVLADNYLMLFLGWEGVGLASYLLISFWQHKPSAAAAGKKAFVVNRVGDLGMIMAIATLFAQLGTVDFFEVNDRVAGLNSTWALLLGLFLLLAACGKSAQFPLQSWLLDAMEGPTPVSALIHAATMVTAGVYLMVRSHAIYAQSKTALTCVMAIGCITLLMGAWIGCAKDDIKKVLAGSTMSQIGYMMLAAGLGPVGYAFAIFHLLTHGFFKANMFLGAGSIMHGMNDDVNMRHFGGLSRAMPWTFGTFLMGYLAIIGIPGFAGWFSKDNIIEAAFEVSPVAGVITILGAGITAFYMTRLMLMTFFGKRRWLEGVHPHESGWLMVIPLVLLAILSVIGGFLFYGWIVDWLKPAVDAEGHIEPLHMLTAPLGLVTLLVVLVGIGIAYLVFGRREIPAVAPASSNPFTVMGRRDLFAEDVNTVVFRDGGRALVNTATTIDNVAVDGAITGAAGATAGLGGLLRKLQNGYVRSYALTMVAGVILVGVVLILGQLG